MRLFHKTPPPSALLQDKLDLIDTAFAELGLRSFADLGGVWGVDGGYTFYALERHKISTATLVDTHPTSVVQERARKHRQLRLIAGNFGDEGVARQVGEVGVIFLFDVLLHQVAPDWDQVLDMYAAQTSCFLIYNQQWTGSPGTVRLLELGEDDYFRNVPHDRSGPPYDRLFEKLDEKHPDHDRPWRDVHHIWQWGISDDDLRAKLEDLGFRQQFAEELRTVREPSELREPRIHVLSVSQSKLRVPPQSFVLRPSGQAV